MLTREDLATIVETLHRFSGVGLFLLSISGQWRLTPSHPDDGVLDEAFAHHQLRESRLGTHAATVLETTARNTGAQVETSASPWHLEAPRDSEFLTRFLTERVDAAIEEEPRLQARGRAWLEDRWAQSGLTVVVDHTDVLIDATVQHDTRTAQLGTRRGEPKR